MEISKIFTRLSRTYKMSVRAMFDMAMQLHSTEYFFYNLGCHSSMGRSR